MRSVDTLHGYQRKAAAFAVNTERCALYMGLGLGKTATALTVAELNLDVGDWHHVLVIAPLRVAKTVWHHEAQMWSHTRHLDFQIAVGDAATRRKAIAERAQLTVINVDLVPWLVENYPRSEWYWDAVIIDESSGFKSPRAKRFRHLRVAAVDKLTRHRDGRTTTRPSTVKGMLLLSATPATNGLGGLWSQMALIDGGERLGRSYSAFEMTYFQRNPYASRFSKPEPIEGAKEKIFERVRDVTYVLRTEDHLELPPLVSREIEVEMPPEAMAGYRELEREFLLSLEEGEVVAPNEGALGNKLLQYANGCVYTGNPQFGEPRGVAHVHDAKLEALREIVSAAEGAQNLLVAYYYQSDLDRLREAFPKAVLLDRAGAQIDDWNAGKIPLLLAHPLSAGMGLNLQAGGSTLVWYSMLWHLEAYQQMIGRVYRQGQHETVVVNHLICKDTIERRIVDALAFKAQTQDEFVRYVNRFATLVAA